MSEGDPSSAINERVAIDAPAQGGEPIEAFYRRSVLDDPIFKSLLRSARLLGVDLAQQRWFRPSCFSSDRVSEYHQALANVVQDPRERRFAWVLDHLWLKPADALDPLDVRMANTPRIDIGDSSLDRTSDPAAWKSALDVSRRAALRRDRLVAAFLDPIRVGLWCVTGFLPGDYRRELVQVPAGWWSDKSMLCHWYDGELRPADGATAGRPTFLGLIMSATSSGPAVATNPRTDRTAAAATLEADLKAWLLTNWPASAWRSKSDWLRDARSAFGARHIPEALFDRVWRNAAERYPDMSKQGRKPLN